MAKSGRGKQSEGVAGGRTRPNEAALDARASGKRRRRWPRRLLIVAVLLAVVIAFAPNLLSTGPGIRMVLGVVNGRIRGTVRIEDLSLSWWGPCRAAGLQVLDPDGREVLRVGEIRLAAGLWSLLTGSGRFESLRVAAPRATLYVAEDGTVSLSRAFEPVKPGPKRPAKPLPKLAGGVTVTDGSVRIVRPDGREYEVLNVNGDLTLDTLDRLVGGIGLDLAGGGQVAATVDLSGLTPGGRFSLDGADGTFRVTMDEPADLDRLTTFAGVGATLRGTARVDLTGDAKAGKLHAAFKVELQRLQSQELERSGVRPIDLALSGDFHADGREIAGKADLTGDAGELRAGFAYRPSAKASPLSLDGVISAAFGGESISLPDFSLDANAAIDLPGLARAVPAAVNIRPGVEITNGTLLVEGVSIRGGERPSLQGRIALQYLAARRRDDDADISCAPVSVYFDAALEKGAGLKIDKARFDSAFGTAEGSGTIDDLKTRFGLNLALLHKELGAVFDLRSIPRKGELTGMLNLTRRGEDRVGIAVDANVSDFEYHRGGRTIHVGAGRVHQDGYVLLEKRRPVEVVLTRGKVTVAALRVNGRRWGDRPVELEWSGVKLHPKDRRVEIASARLDGPPGSITAEQVRLNLSDDFRADGKLSVSADLNAASAILAPSRFGVESKGASRIAGRLDWSGTCSSAGGVVSFAGAGGIRDLRVEGEGRAFRQEKLAFTQDIVLDRGKEVITVKRMSLNAAPLFSLQLGGTISRFQTDRLLDLTGSYEGSWEDITRLLHSLAPGTAETVALTGNTRADFRVTGPAHRPEVRPVFRDVAAGTELGWKSANFYGVALGEAKLSPQLREGQVRLPETAIAAVDGGKVRLRGIVDLEPPAPVFRLPGKVKLLEDLTITRRMGRQLLSRFNPIFSQLAAAEGEVSLETNDLVLPLSREIAKSGSGSGRLDLEKLKVRPEGILSTLLQLGGVAAKDKAPVQVTGVDFTIRDGRIHYDNFTLLFAGGFDLRFYGSVGFDDTLDLAVSVPVRAELLQRFGVRGPVLDYARLLSGARVAIPLIGTRLKPGLDFSKVDLRPLIDRAVIALLTEEAARRLRELLQGRKKDKEKPDSRPENEEKDSGGGIDLSPIFDLLRDRLERQE